MKAIDSSEKIKKRGKRISSRLIFGLSVLFIIVAGILTLLVFKEGGVKTKPNIVDAMNPLIDELFSLPTSGLPEYAITSKKTQAGYAVALEIPVVLEKIPCYCSCDAIGHKSLKDCFRSDAGGFVDHASYCDLCVNEAFDVYVWQKDGLSRQDIRSRIDEKYSRYGEPTDTPQI